MNKSNWVSVNKKLPKPYRPLLIICLSKNKKFRMVVEGMYCPNCPYYEKSSKWAIKEFCEENRYIIREEGSLGIPKDGLCIYGEITHWTYLPKLPKELNEKHIDT